MQKAGAVDAVLEALDRRWLVVASVAGFFAAVAARAVTLPVEDADVWWIAAAGRDMLATGRVPTENAYSFTAPTHPWVMHEILFGLLYALGVDALGPAAFPLLSLLLGAIVVAIAAAATSARAHRPASVLLAILLIVVGCRGALFAPRPSHASLFLPVAMAALAFAPGFGARRACGAVLLEILWTNAHGSFLLGVAILSIAAFAEDARGSRAARLAAAGSAAAVTLANPYGVRLHRLVDAYLFGHGTAASVVHRHIVEFWPILESSAPFVNPFNAVALGAVVALAASALIHRRNLARAALVLGLAGLACHQARHVTIAVVVGVVVMHAELDALTRGGEAPADLGWLRRLPLAVVPGLALGTALWALAAWSRTPEQWIAPTIGGEGVWRLAGALPEGARTYTRFDDAGLLIWRGAPRGVRVLFDSRNDCYPAEVAEAAFALEGAGSIEIAEATLARLGAEYALVPEGHPVFAALGRSGAWSAWRREGRWTAFRRREVPAAAGFP
ncbi:MAG: hypothetical protein HYY35_11010 [Deltaproteobacteria bacterium]|nr:hypothetical protein [Deltaproteobacteria bacterium]